MDAGREGPRDPQAREPPPPVFSDSIAGQVCESESLCVAHWPGAAVTMSAAPFSRRLLRTNAWVPAFLCGASQED